MCKLDRGVYQIRFSRRLEWCGDLLHLCGNGAFVGVLALRSHLLLNVWWVNNGAENQEMEMCAYSKSHMPLIGSLALAIIIYPSVLHLSYILNKNFPFDLSRLLFIGMLRSVFHKIWNLDSFLNQPQIWTFYIILNYLSNIYPAFLGAFIPYLSRV